MTWRLASLLGRHGGDYGTKDIQVLHCVIWPWRRILNGACISISNLRENIAWQTHRYDLRPEARGPLKSGAWGSRPTCHPQTPPLSVCVSSVLTFWTQWRIFVKLGLNIVPLKAKLHACMRSPKVEMTPPPRVLRYWECVLVLCFLKRKALNSWPSLK